MACSYLINNPYISVLNLVQKGFKTGYWYLLTGRHALNALWWKNTRIFNVSFCIEYLVQLLQSVNLHYTSNLPPDILFKNPI